MAVHIPKDSSGMMAVIGSVGVRIPALAFTDARTGLHLLSLLARNLAMMLCVNVEQILRYTIIFMIINSRCRKYDNLPQNCILVADPSDPQCCKVPSCIPGPNGFPTPTPGPDGSTVAPQLITNVPVGVVTGYAKPTPTATPSPVPVGGTTAKPMPTPAPRGWCSLLVDFSKNVAML